MRSFMRSSYSSIVGSVFAGDYRVESLLAEGGMGAVFVATQLSTERRRALKLLTPSLASDHNARERFLREARVSSTIESEHVVAVIDAGIDDETSAPYLVMELLEGQELAAYVASRASLDRAEVHELLAQLCHALAAAHAVGVIHRDLKPENVFVARSRRADVPFTVKLLDFGIAAILESSATSHATSSVVGSPAWMAPEQVDTGLIRASTDVWALGLLAFWLLTGRHYWKSANRAESTLQALLVEKLVEPLVAASERAQWLGVGERIPEGFDQWFARCVCRDPSARFRDAREAWIELDPVLREGTAPSPMVVGTLPTLVSTPSGPAFDRSVASPSASHSVIATVIAQPTGGVLSDRARPSSMPSRAILIGALSMIAASAGAAVLVMHRRAASPPTVVSIAQTPAEHRASPRSSASASATTAEARTDAAVNAGGSITERGSTAERTIERRSHHESRLARTTSSRSARSVRSSTGAFEQAAPPDLARTIPSTTHGDASAPVTPSGPRPNRCAAYASLERQAQRLLAHADSIEATDPSLAQRERIQAMALRSNIDTQVAQLRTMARGELSGDADFVAMVRDVEQCLTRIRGASP
jgi:serine/threonine protein kinase